jgi:putative PIN family toxin of toxin-antitoxin system
VTVRAAPEAIVPLVIDTNIWVSALINPRGAPARLMQAVHDGRVRLILSAGLLSEIQAVLCRDRIRRRIALDENEVDTYLRVVARRSVLVSISGSLQICRDPKDDLILETAIVGGARFVVSRDEDLTRDLHLIDALQSYGIDVLTVARMLDLLLTDAP